MKRLYVWQQPDWPVWTWDDDALLRPLGQARFVQGDLLARVKALGMDLGKAAQAEILVEEALKTSAIEGETFDLKSVRSSVAKHLGLPMAGVVADDRHIDGLVEVLLDATQNYHKPLVVSRLKSWHAALFPTGYSGLRRIRAGKWRGALPMRVVSGHLGKEKVHFEAPLSNQVEREMQKFLSWWKKDQKNLEGLLRAGVAHFHFVTIHPFEDGNGRLARALTDMALAQDEAMPVRFYSLSSQIMKERKIYYDILEKIQKGRGDITEWLLWFLSCFTRAIENSETILSNVLAKAEFWRKHAHQNINDRQRKILNRLLDKGVGVFEGGLTTKKYVSMAKVSRATAFREMIDLVNKGILKQRQGKGRNVSYDIASS